MGPASSKFFLSGDGDAEPVGLFVRYTQQCQTPGIFGQDGEVFTTRRVPITGESYCTYVTITVNGYDPITVIHDDSTAFSATTAALPDGDYVAQIYTSSDASGFDASVPQSRSFSVQSDEPIASVSASLAILDTELTSQATLNRRSLKRRTACKADRDQCRFIGYQKGKAQNKFEYRVCLLISVVRS